MRHYTDFELDRLRFSGASRLKRMLCRLHLRFCTGCRGRMAALVADDRLLIELRQALQTPSDPDDDWTRSNLKNHFQEDTGSTL